MRYIKTRKTKLDKLANTIYSISDIGGAQMKGFGSRVLKLLDEVGYTQREFAVMVGVSEPALSRYLKDEREPKMEIIANMATALNTTTDYLLTGKKDKESFDETYRLVARGTSTMTDDEKTKLIKVLLNNGKK